MWKLTGLFSLLLLFGSVLADPLRESINLRVKVVGKILEEKPKLLPPERIELKEEITHLDLSKDLLEPPKEIEEAPIDIPKEEQGCGGPKDRSYYRAGVKSYLKGRLKKAESKMLDVLSIQNSAFIPQAEYVLGLIYSKTRREKKALNFLKSSCEAQHPYRMPACEALYALKFRLEGKPVRVDTPDLWSKVYSLKEEGKIERTSCSDTVFTNYCAYVNDFVEGKENTDYRESTELRKGIILLEKGKEKEAKGIFERYSRPLSPYRDVALYYLGVIALRNGDLKLAYKYASLLETSRPDYADSLYLMLSGGDVILSRLAYQSTGSRLALRNAGVLFYNEGKDSLAYAEFEKAGDYLFATWSAIRDGDYRRAYISLKKVEDRDRDYYVWLLETLYWLGKDEEMERVLEEIKEATPELYREYLGWLMFRKERWTEAARYFTDAYHKALAFYNAGRYEEVIDILEGRDGYKERLLKAKASISMGKGELARMFLTEETPEELYLLGMSFFIEGNYREAITYFEKLLKENALKSRAMLRIADSYYNLGNYDRAKEIYKEILTLYPNSKEALDATLALVQIELQRPSQDLKTLSKEFMSKFPDSPLIPDIKLQLASLYIKEGNREEAKRILTELSEMETYRTRALIKLAEIEEDPLRKEELLKQAIMEGSKKEKEIAISMLKNLYLERKEFKKLADFLSGGSFEDRKRALEIYISEDLQKAIEFFDELMKENSKDEELRKIALTMYSKTKGKKYLKIAKESNDPEVRAKALYLLGRMERKRDKRKALEYFVEVILTAKGVQPYYNRSILEAVDILISLRARRDASCLLDKLDHRYLTKRDIKKVKILRKKLPKCEVKK